jgi:hypothetical protein
MYGELKELVLQAFEVSPARLHLLAGLVFYALCFAVTRRPWLSLFLLLSLQLGNEFLDAGEDVPLGIWSPREAIVDTVWTVALPTAAAGCLAAARTVVAALNR